MNIPTEELEGFVPTVPIIIQVLPGQAEGGSFKFETLIAYRAEQRLCISSHLISAYLSFSDFHSSSQLFSALRSSCKLILCVLISSLLFQHLLSSSHIYSADLSSCQLVSPHLTSSQRTLKSSHLFSGPKPAPKTDLGAKASNPYAFHREDLTQRNFYRQQAFAQRSLYMHREVCTRKNFYTELGNFLFIASFYTKQAFAHSKLLPRFFNTQNFLHRYFFYTEVFKQRSLYTEKLLHTASFDAKKLLHRKAFTYRKFSHTEAFTQLLPTEAFTHSKLLHTASFYTEKLLHREDLKQRSFCARKAFRRQFRSQTSDNMDRWKAEMGRLSEEKRRRKRKSQKKEDPDARKGRKVAKRCFSNDLWLWRVEK